MTKRRMQSFLAVLASGAVLWQTAGCMVDPDIILRAGISAGSDIAVFLLENLAASI